ncbi:MAG: hypothetical protein ACKE8G_04375 [Methylophagaceae bacterium]
MLKIIGMLLMAFGATDLIGSYAGFDLWGTLGIQLPDAIWQYSSYIELGLGYVLMKLGGSSDDAE